MFAIARQSLFTAVFVTALIFAAPHAFGKVPVKPLVSAEWLKGNLGNDGILILDIRSALAGASKVTFEAGHIPGAIYSNYLTGGWRVKNAEGTPGVLPPVGKLEALFGQLGISNDSHVVIVGAGKKALDMGSATRVYWTLKVAGHDKVSILDGGYKGWKSKKANPVETGATSVKSAAYTVSLQADLLASKSDVKAALGTNITLVDNRPANQFVGINKHPASKRLGTIPGAKNVPENWLTQNGGGYFRNKQELGKLYSVAKVSGQGDEINFCNTGHWASLGWFVSHELLGNKNAKLYDGSIVEWSADTSAPMSQKISVQ